MRDPALGTIGGGNHFCEFQVVESIVDRKRAYELGVKVGDVMVMVHSGSRDVGFYVGNHWMKKAKEAWPKGQKHPSNKAFAIEGLEASEYLEAMTVAAHYATTNRALIAEIVRQRIGEVWGKWEDRLITDVPHNIILQEKWGNVHRKGATPAHKGQMLLIPGSMGAHSYLLTGLGNEDWLNSASHGAGRSVARNEMRFKTKGKNRDLGLESIECITLKEERRIEEAPGAYKAIGPVIKAQEEEGTVSTIARMAPLVTFKA